MKAALLIVAGIAAMVVAATPAVGGRSHGPTFLTDARVGYGNQSHSPAFVTDARVGYGSPANAGVTRFVTDGRGGYLPSVDSSVRHRFITDTRGGYGRPTLVSSPGAPSIGFDWADAAVGGGVTAGILMLLGGGTLVALRRRGRLAL